MGSSLVAQKVKNLLARQETWVWSLDQEDSPRGGHGNPLQYSCLENPKNRGAWWATVHGVTESDMMEVTNTFILMQNLVSWPGIKPQTPALGAQSLSHWTTRDVPKVYYLLLSHSIASYVFIQSLPLTPQPQLDVSASGLLHMKLLWTCVYKSLDNNFISFQ